jgi:uncharacterized protein YcbX
LLRYPVKSMGGAELASVAVTPGGIPGDRGWALRDRATGMPASAKRFAVLMLCRARYLGEPADDAPPPPAEVELPDGTRTRTDDPASAELLSRLLGADVAFSREDHGAGHFDDKPLHLLTTAALRSMASRFRLDFDARRFRPNIVVDLDGDGKPEDAWVGREVRVGGVDIRVLKPVERCVMTTLPQPGLSAEKGIFSAFYSEGGALGVYGTALSAGTWRVGDPVAPVRTGG